MAELRLDVTLNLAAFRGQLGKLAQEAGSRYFGVNLSIDKANFKKQLKELEKIKPVITINDSQLVAAKQRINTLNKSLATLRRATSTPIEIKVKYVEQGKPPTGAISKSGTFRQRLTGLDAEPIKQLYAAAGKAGLLQFDTEIAKSKSKIITALNQAGESSVTGLLNGLKSKDSAVKTAAKSLGDILIAALKLSLQIQSPSKKMEAIGEDAGEGFNKGLKDSLNEAKTSAVGQMRGIVSALRAEAAKIQNISLTPASLRGGSRVGSGFRALPEGASQAGAGVEFSEMMRRFRGEIAGLTTNPKQYQQFLNALPDSRITTNLTDAASRRSRAAEMPSFMPIQRTLGQGVKLGQGELEKQIISDLAQYIKSIRIPNPWVGPTGDYQKFIGNISRTTRQLTSQSLLPLPRAVKLLPPGSSPTFQQTVAARTQVAYQRSAARSATVLGGPSAPAGGGSGGVPPVGGGGGLPPRGGVGGGGGGIPFGGGNAPTGGGGGGVPPSGGGGAGGGGGVPPRSGGGGAFAGMQFTMPKLPGRGIVQELGTEFAFAAKQVLLFGAAYKALAFLTDFPSKVGEAVGQLQSFRNTIKAISPTANEAAQSSQFILDVVDKYNVPLQSARDGFTKLYASMEPTGFSGNEIRDLFTGISQAAATFGMSSDKVDRVTYAFAQMASKGQVMSEELKGQLGDVLPGAMGIFAKAAGFEGADAIQKFGKALEDGAYKGKPMRDLLKNVTIELKKEFGPGAEGAARTYQGVMTRMANSTKLFYETFEPVAVGFLNAVVMPITAGIKQLTDGFNAFFTGQAAQTAGGNSLAQQLNDLKPSFDGILANLKSLIPSFQIFGNLLLQVAKFLTALAGNPIVGFLLKVYANIFLVNTAFTLLGGKILVGLIVSINAAIFRLVAFGYAINAVGIQTTGANTALAGTRSQLLLLQGSAAGATAPLNALMGSLLKIAAIAAAAIVITVIVNGLTEMKDAEARLARLREERDPVGPAGPRLISTAARRYAGASREKILSDQQKQIDLLAKYRLDLAKMEKDDQDNRAAASTGFGGKIPKNTSAANIEALKIKIKDAEDVVNLNPKQFKTQKDIESAAERIAKIKLEGGDDDKKRKAEEEKQAKLQDTLANREQQLAVDNANRQVALDQSSFDSRLRMSDAEYDYKRALQDSYFEREISGLDSIEARQKKFQQDLKAIENRRIDSIRKAELDSVKAVQDLRSATTKAIAVTGGALGDSSKYVDRSVLRKYLESQGFSRTSGDFTNKGHKTPDHMRNAMDYGIMGGSDADALRKTIAMERKLRATGAFGNQLFGPESDPYGHGAGKGGRNIHLHMPTPDEKIKLTPGLAALIGGESLQSSAVGLNTRSGAFAMGRRGDKAEGNLELEQQEVLIKQSEKLTTVRNANLLAIEETATRIKQNLDSIFPIKEQQLENDLLELRNKLELDGTSKEIIDMEIEKTKKTKESAISVKDLTTNMLELTATLDAYSKKKILTEQDAIEMDRLTKQIILLEEAIAALPGAQRQFNDELARTAKLTKAGSFDLRIKALKDEIKLLATVDDAERRVLELTQGASTLEEAQQIYSLEKVKKNLEDTKALVGSFVSSTVSDYKGFLKAVISGEDAVDALKKFQEGLTDKVLTIFLDFTMAPVEEMMKKSLEKLFMPKANVAEVPITANTTELAKNTIAINNNTTALSGKTLAGSIDPMSSEDFSNSVPVKVQPLVSPENAFAGFDTENPFAGLNDQIRAGLAEIPSSFAEATANLQISSEPFKQALITDLSKTVGDAGTGVQTQGALFGEGLTNFVGGLGVAAAGITGIAAGISQIGKGGTSNVLGGIGSILMGAGGAIGGFGKLFGVKGFANGGMVTRPTLGMVGEGRFNEAIVPLPNGRSIPVQLNQDSSLRNAMGSNNSNNATAPVLNMSFETTRIGNTDYVSREQLEAAMMQTRAEATRAGARRGMTMTLDKLQQSPSTRSRVGLG